MSYNNILTTPMLEIMGIIPPGPHVPYDEVYVTGQGQRMRVHRKENCAGEFCVIHNPSVHAMSEFPTLWRSDRGLMERICPHGIGHPDPDHIAVTERLQGADAARTEGVHGCDGCCAGCYYTIGDTDA